MKLLSIGLSDATEQNNFDKNHLKKNSLREEDSGIKKAVAEIEETKKSVKKIRDAVEEALSLLADDGFIVKTDEVQKGSYTFLECYIEEGELSFKNYERIKEVLKKCIADALADFILKNWEDNIIEKIVKQNYTYFCAEEHELLIANTKETLNGDCHKKCDFNVKERRQIIWRTILEYLDAHHELVLEGFINFRLKGYQQKIAGVIESVTDEFMMAEEYKEFIRVLRYFADIQPPKTEEVHVVINGSRTFKILDKGGNLINTHYLENIVTQNHANREIEFMPEERNSLAPAEYKAVRFKQIEFKPNDIINYEDALISVLITIAPNNIIIHSNNSPQNKETIETIKSVFKDRVITCSSCEICKIEKIEGESLTTR